MNAFTQHKSGRLLGQRAFGQEMFVDPSSD